jgi:predicted DNA-binding protein YlxM (UPF0122 family)
MTPGPYIREIARDVLTTRQLDVWTSHAVHGYSFRLISHHFGISRTTVTDHYDAACRKLRAHGVHVTPDGTHYLNGDGQ